MGKTYPWEETPTISDEQMAAFKELVESHGITADVGR
jgi:hypothetical protein